MLPTLSAHAVKHSVHCIAINEQTGDTVLTTLIDILQLPVVVEGDALSQFAGELRPSFPSPSLHYGAVSVVSYAG